MLDLSTLPCLSKPASPALQPQRLASTCQPQAPFPTLPFFSAAVHQEQPTAAHPCPSVSLYHIYPLLWSPKGQGTYLAHLAQALCSSLTALATVYQP